MKRILSVMLACLLTLGLTLTPTAVRADDILMLYDCEDTEGNGPNQPPWGQGPGVLDYENYTEGLCGLDTQAIFWPGLMMFHNLPQNFPTDTGFADISDYDYVEFDMYSFYEMICDVELCLCRNEISHHGSDCELLGMYLPETTFVHVRMPIADFVTHSQENRDRFDEVNDKYGPDGPEPSPELHYSGYALDEVHRIRVQLTFCTDVEGNELDDVEVVFDNFTAVKGDAGHAHREGAEVIDLMTWEEYRQSQQSESSQPQPPEESSSPVDPVSADDPSSREASSSPVGPSEASSHGFVPQKAGDVNGDGAVDAKDALMVLKASVGKIALTDVQKIAANVNGDDTVDAKDALAILKISVGKG